MDIFPRKAHLSTLILIASLFLWNTSGFAQLKTSLKTSSLPILQMGNYPFSLDGMSEEPSKQNFSKDVATVFKGTGYTISRPFHWDKRDWRTAVIWAALIGGSLLIEEEVDEFFQKNRSNFGDTVNDIGVKYGAPPFAAGLSLGVYAVGTLIGSPAWRETSIMMFELLLTVGIIQQPLRIITGRARPRANEDNLTFNPLSIKDKYSSFISGHVWISVGLSYIMAKQIDHPVATGILFTLGAVVTPYARMYGRAHWASDILIGGVLGFYSARTIMNWHKGKALADNALLILPTPGGVRMTYRF